MERVGNKCSNCDHSFKQYLNSNSELLGLEELFFSACSHYSLSSDYPTRILKISGTTIKLQIFSNGCVYTCEYKINEYFQINQSIVIEPNSKPLDNIITGVVNDFIFPFGNFLLLKTYAFFANKRFHIIRDMLLKNSDLNKFLSDVCIRCSNGKGDPEYKHFDHFFLWQNAILAIDNDTINKGNRLYSWGKSCVEITDTMCRIGTVSLNVSQCEFLNHLIKMIKVDSVSDSYEED